MQRSIYQLLAPPVFAEEDKTRRAAILTAMAWSALLIVGVILVLRTLQGQDPNLIEVNIVLTGLILISGLVIYLTHRGYVQAAGTLFVVAAWICLTGVAWIADGIRDVTFFASIIPILTAGLLLGWRGAILVTLASIASGWMLAYAEANRFFNPSLDQPMNFARDASAILALTGLLVYLTISGLQNALDRSRRAADELARSNRDVNDLRMELERRVEERTLELKKRAAQLEAVASVARTIASVQDPAALLPAIVELVSQRFGFYHVGIFLLDQHNRAVMRASSSEGGRLLVDQGFSLAPDEYSMVGYSIANVQARVSQDVTTDSVYLNNPNLPETRSEIALPLRVAGRVIGALDVQSKEIQAFSETEISMLSTLADQVAIAIENARLYSEAKNALGESRALFEKYTQQEWSNFARQAKQTGYLFDGKSVSPLDRNVKREQTRTAIQTGSLHLEKESTAIAIPIKVRGQTIGVLDVRSKRGERVWKQEEITMLQAAAERAALALENARLVESAQRRAARERAIGDISTRIGAVSNLESILQAAVEELGRKIGGATEVTLEITRDETDSA
jgi:GAF domain-containing protein